MQAKGSATRIVFDFEDSFGVPKAEGVRTGYSLPFITCSLKDNQDLGQSEEIRGNRNAAQPFTNNINPSGNLVVPVRSIAFGYLLKAMMGAPVSSGTTTYTHKFVVDATDSIPSFIIEKWYTDLTVPYYELFTGCKIASMELSVSSSGETQATFAIVASKCTGGTTAYVVSPTNTGGTKFMMKDATVSEGGTACSVVKSVSVKFSNELDEDQFCVGGGGIRGDLPEGIAQVSGQLSALFTNTTLLAKATGTTESTLVIEFNPADSTDNLKITLPEVVYARTGPEISGPKGIVLDLNYTGYYGDNTDQSCIAIELTNTQASYA